jgi:GTP-binding protein Era
MGLSVLEGEIQARMKELGIPVHSSRRISALKEQGLRELVDETAALLPEGPLFFEDQEQLSDRPTRFFVAEKIREQLFHQLGDELPYSCAVEIEKFEEPGPDSPLTRIEAVIHVERDSQKGIVIGKGGTKIKSIGQKARAGIEEFLGGKVFLGLRVKVLKDWTKDAESLKRMGYHLPESP